MFLHELKLWKSLIAEVVGFDENVIEDMRLNNVLAKRLAASDSENLSDFYLSLKGDPESKEMQLLIDEVVINETRFFRDTKLLKLLNNEILPRLINSTDEIKVLVVGCSTGEEAYTAVIVMRDALSDSGANVEIKIDAVDISERVLREAKSGFFRSRSVQLLSSAALARSFTKNGDGYIVNNDIRRCVSFVKGNAMRLDEVDIGDNYDIVISQNMLVYFNQKKRLKALDLMADKLKPGGQLITGYIEWLGWDNQQMEIKKASNMTIFTKKWQSGN